jgi:hypothetical protein
MKLKIAISLCIVLSIALGVLYFTPWTGITFTCSDSPLSSDWLTLGTASGWELAKGDMSASDLVEPLGEEDHAQDDSDLVARRRFLLGLVLPIVTLVVGVLSLTKRLHVQRAGLLISISSAIGALVILSALKVDYVLGYARSGDWGTTDVEVVRELMSDTFATIVYPGVWISLVLYVMNVLIGMCLFSMDRPRTNTG